MTRMKSTLSTRISPNGKFMRRAAPIQRAAPSCNLSRARVILTITDSKRQIEDGPDEMLDDELVDEAEAGVD